MKNLTLTHSSPQDAPDAQAQPLPGEPFSINSLEAANWLLRCLANQDAERKRVYDQALTIVRQLDADTAPPELPLRQPTRSLYPSGTRTTGQPP